MFTQIFRPFARSLENELRIILEIFQQLSNNNFVDLSCRIVSIYRLGEGNPKCFWSFEGLL